MEQPNLQNLKYGIIYAYFDQQRMSRERDAAPLVEKCVYPMQVEWVDQPGLDDLILAARRFNVGNVGRYATVSLHLTDHNRYGGQSQAIHKFADVLMGVSDTGGGDIVLREDDFGCKYTSVACEEISLPQAAPQDKTRVESPGAKFAKKAARWLKEKASRADMAVLEEMEVCRKKEEWAPDLLEEEQLEVKRLERDRKEALDRIKRDIVNYIARYHDDPKELMAELLRGKVVVGQPGRVLVNGDMKIVLPEYDEMEIPMPAMCRTLYILFLKQRKAGSDGIVLKNIDAHREEIIDIYGMVKPGANERRVIQTVDNLCDPFGDSLNQMISRINRCVRNVITDKELAKQYTITGIKGEEYSIALDPEYLELPRAITA